MMFIEGSEEPDGDIIDMSYATEDLRLIVSDFAGVVLITSLSSNRLPWYSLFAYLKSRLTEEGKADIAVVDHSSILLASSHSQSGSSEFKAARRGASFRAIISSLMR